MLVRVDLQRRYKQEDPDANITRRRWRWLGQFWRRGPQTITRKAYHWTTDRKRRRRKPRTMLRRTIENEMKAM